MNRFFMLPLFGLHSMRIDNLGKRIPFLYGNDSSLATGRYTFHLGYGPCWILDPSIEGFHTFKDRLSRSNSDRIGGIVVQFDRLTGSGKFIGLGLSSLFSHGYRKIVISCSCFRIESIKPRQVLV